MDKITKPKLKTAATALNEVLGLEPPILVNLKVEELEAKVKEASGLIDPQQDEFSEEVWEILGTLGCDPRVEASDDPPAKPEPDVETEAKTAPAVKEAMDDTLVVDFKAAKKLKELKEVAQEWECFASLDLDSYAGLQGPKQLRADMLECMPEGVREQIEPPQAEKAVKKVKTPKGPGVIATIASSIENAGKKGITKEEILKKLVAEFPDREEDRMKKTINVQVPTRISKERFKVGVEDGRYFKE